MLPAFLWYASCTFVLGENFWYSYHMKQSLMHVALLVRDYDEAIAFYTKKLHFTVVEDTYQPEQEKRWVLVAPPGSSETTLLLARASTIEQESCISIVFINCNQNTFSMFWYITRDTSAQKCKKIWK
jgi:hypothetical protein